MKFRTFAKEHKRTLIPLFLIPVILIAVYVFLGIVVKDLKNIGGWAEMLGGLLAYIGTVILGLLAFWQNERAIEMNKYANEMNERLIKLERARNAPIFDLSWASITKNGISFNLTNVSQNLACELKVSNLEMETLEALNVIHRMTYAIKLDKPISFLEPMAHREITFDGNPLKDAGFTANQTGKMIICVYSTDIFGQMRKTTIEVLGKSYYSASLKYKYLTEEI
ncbi:MAG: hypothetical protein LBM65_02545 [Oscillospiraceae bacterium]|jgi:hypothetical protein|nr:hypothetical protein [Oscillospiraceae bacterium]